jgi:hypothetical protein
VVGVRAVAAVCVLLTGCFYIDPILPRPSVHLNAPEAIQRGGQITMSAELVDTDSAMGSFDWDVFSCAEYGNGTPVGCDKDAFYSRPNDASSTASFMVPATTAAGGKTQAIHVDLRARSDRGALALPDGNSVFPVGDAAPVVQLTRQSHSLAVGGPIDVIATYSDLDSSLDGFKLDWMVTAPPGAGAYAFSSLPVVQDPGDPGHRKAVARLTPTVTGSWDVQVTARDPEGVASTQDLMVAVVADQPPCLRQWLPTVPPPGATLPISTPTVFQVPVVDDDLDPYPPISEEPRLAFAWSVLRPGGTREVQTGATGNAFVLDPAAFTPGDSVELRVEIDDRQQTALPCDDAAATCSIVSSDSCLQRQTWRIEVR